VVGGGEHPGLGRRRWWEEQTNLVDVNLLVISMYILEGKMIFLLNNLCMRERESRPLINSPPHSDAETYVHTSAARTEIVSTTNTLQLLTSHMTTSKKGKVLQHNLMIKLSSPRVSTFNLIVQYEHSTSLHTKPFKRSVTSILPNLTLVILIVTDQTRTGSNEQMKSTQ
jgi:hypothetical protein